MEATGGGTLDIKDALGNSNDVTASGSGSTVTLEGNVTNTGGTLLATGGGELDVKASTITDNLGGTEQINTGSELLVDSGHLTLTGDGSGKVVLSGTALISGASKSDELENVNKTISGAGTISNLDLVNDSAGTIDATGILAIDTGNTITNAGLMEATGGGTLDIQDNTIANSGTGALGIKVDGTSTFEVDVANLQLTGSGAVTLLAGSQLIGNAAGDTLDNVNNTISGAGTIGYLGNGKLTLNNESGGTIDANQSGQTLAIDTGNQVSNAGLMEATAGGILDVADALSNTDEVEASGSGSKVTLEGNVTNTGATAVLLATAGGELDVKASTIPTTSAAPNRSTPARSCWSTPRI